MTWGMPSIGGIQRTNITLVLLGVLVLGFFVSRDAAIGCLIGGGIVIANLLALSMLGRLMLTAAAGGSGAGSKLRALAIPLKLLIVITVAYLLFEQVHLDGLGFGLGVLTQMLAVIIETGRASLSAAS